MAFGRKQKIEQKGEASAVQTPSAMRLFLPGAALGLLLFVMQGSAFDGGTSPWSIGAILASRLVADAVIGIVGLCAVYIALYAARWGLAQAWGWARVNLLRRGTRP
ncbi:MAG: hypothetical protein KGJ66_15490 [Alphaproteobacteria bacterium]|nr:hypothetical protein [Alphaproteobacteria bacterium]